MLRRIRQMIRKELLQTVREPRMRFFLFLPPLMQLLLFGYAVNLDLQDSRIAWLDRDQTPHSRQLREAFSASQSFTIVSAPDDAREAQALMDRGEVLAVIAVLPGFARRLERGEQAAVQVLVEGSNSNTASLVSNYATQVINNFAADFHAEPLHLNIPQVVARSRVWFNEEMESRNYFVPGVVVNIIMLVTVLLTALAIVREKEIGTMEQLMVTPIRPIELVIGKTVPFAIVGIAQLVLVTSAALLVFRIPFRGSALLLLFAGILFLMTTLGIGLFLSTLASTQQQAALSTFMITMPAFMLSGFAFPIDNMPIAFQYLTYLNPLRYFIEIVRGIFLKGSGIDILWPQMLALAGFGVAVLGLSALCFRKRLD